MRVMIESPYRGESFEHFIRNIDYAHKAVKDSLARGEAPFAMHLFYPQWLQEEIREEREKGIALGLQWLRSAELVAFYIDFGYSAGMRVAFKEAEHYGVLVEERKLFPDGWRHSV